MLEIKDIGSLGIDVYAYTESEIIAYCPFHDNRNTPAFSINRKTRLWQCLNPSCGKKGSWAHLCTSLGKSEMASVIDISVEDIESKLAMFEDTVQLSLDDEFEKMVLFKDRAIDYMRKRGFSLAVLNHFEIVFSEKKNRVVIPVRDANYNLVSFIGRSVDPNVIPKYLYSKGFKRRETIFNIQNARHYKSVIVTEGSLDAIKVHQAGFPNVVSTLGAQITEAQLNILTDSFESIILMLDNDEAGERARCDIIKRCGHKELWLTMLPEGVKDPGDMNDDEIRNVIENKKYYLEFLLEKE